jgi:hypothetical protein
VFTDVKIAEGQTELLILKGTVFFVLLIKGLK